MIEKDEIDKKSIELEVHASSVEKDYVFGWLLYGIFTASDLKDTIFLKGGNALRKGYLENTRFSADLDFGIPGDIEQDSLLNELNKVCDFIQNDSGISFINDDNNIREKFTASETPIPGLKVYEARIYFKDFYGKADHLKIRISMDVTRFDKVLLPIQEVKLIHPYSDAEKLVCNIRCMKMEEIIATKLKCLLQRQHAPDLFDYAYTIEKMGNTINKIEVADTLLKKTIFERNPQVLKRILIKTSFDYFKAHWEKAITCAKQSMVNFENAIETLMKDLEELFSPFQDTGFTDFVFFGSELRGPIMQAGRDQTLLRIRYTGADRVVEPYSLKYLERKNGQAREYLYVYNRSGGNSEPGIRCFVADKIESIENTNDNFEPREGYPIELSKAGELQEKQYLFDPNKPMRMLTRRLRKLNKSGSTFGPKYIYQCSFCGKQFTKRDYNGSLNQHKNKNGNTCGGRHGYYVRTVY